MLNPKVKLFGQTVSTWLVALTLLASTAGAAAGIVLSGQVKGEITTTVDQALVVKSVSGAGFNGVADDGTGFTAVTEISTGDKYTLKLDLHNRSADTLAAKLTLDMPPGITVSARAAAGQSELTELVRVGLGAWLFKLASGDAADNELEIEVAHADPAPPGFYPIIGAIKQISLK